MATLDYLNYELFDSKIKIVLVTGTSSVAEAGRQCSPLTAARSGMQVTFTDEYIRHPQWIMSDEHFFDIIRGNESVRRNSTLDRWIRVLFADGLADKESDNAFPDGVELEKIPEAWSSLIEVLTTAKYGSKSFEAISGAESKGRLISRLKKLSEAGALNKESFLDIFETPVTRSLSQLYLSSALIGLLESAAVIKRPTRLMPAVIFDEPFTEYNRYSSELIELFDPAVDFSARRSKVANLRVLNEEINSAEFDPSLYHSHIIHAEAFAAIDLWDPGITLCSIAMRIADALLKDNPDSAEVRRGREASYLASILARRSARVIDDLGKAREFLAEALRREDPGRQAEDLRFTVERTVQQIREAYFRFFSPDSPNTLDAADFTSTLKLQVAELETALSGLASYADVHSDPKAVEKARNWIQRQALKNLFEVCILLFALESDMILQFRDLFVTFYNSVGELDKKRDPHAWLVCRLSEIILNPNQFVKNRSLLNQVERHIARFERIASYEIKRDDAFRFALKRAIR